MSALSLHSQLETGNRFLEIVTILQGDELECPDQPRPGAAFHRQRPGRPAPRHRGRPGQHRAQRLRHRHRPDRAGYAAKQKDGGRDRYQIQASKRPAMSCASCPARPCARTALLARGLRLAVVPLDLAGRGTSRPAGDPPSRGVLSPGRTGAPVFGRLQLSPGSSGVPNRDQSRPVIPVTGAEARNSAFLPAARVPGFGFRVGVVNARAALSSSSSRSAFPLHGWSRGCDGRGRMPVGGSVSLRRQATCGDGGPAAIAARMLAASPAGMPAVLALPRGITVATAWPAGGPGSGTVRRGRPMTEAWSCGVPGQFTGRGGCRWRAEVPGHLGRALPGRRRGTLDSVRIRSDPAG